jgi:ABC-type polysaccharide/polyol phosphate transport system ATPase subunit
MRARLAFSVALKMQAELLLIDEVLSVGDGNFQQKAEEAMHSKISSDQTVVLVSHSMNQIERLCDRVLWLDHGHVRLLGPPSDVVGEYGKFLGTF